MTAALQEIMHKQADSCTAEELIRRIAYRIDLRDQCEPGHDRYKLYTNWNQNDMRRLRSRLNEGTDYPGVYEG